VTVLAVRIDYGTRSREQPRLLVDVQRKKGCVERILRVTSESYYRVPSLQQYSYSVGLDLRARSYTETVW
jgi:hypothetical protein